MPSAEIVKAVDALLALDERPPTPLPLPNDDTIRIAEAATGLTFPEDYRYFLKRAGNVCVEGFETLLPESGERNFGHLGLIAGVETARAKGVRRDWLPFCEDNADYYCILPDETVELWSHDGLFEGRWPDFSSWIMDAWLNR